MAVKVYRPGSGPKTYRRIAFYGDPKIGKTRLATSLPWGEEYGWGNKAVYIAADPGNEDWEMSPIMPADREHLILARGEGDKADPYEDAVEMASKDWKAEDPEIGTIIWDTMTSTAEDILEAVAAQGRYGNSISFGKGKSQIVHAQMGDYGATQMMVQNVIDFLFSQPLNVIVLFHAKMTDPDDGEQVGGPATVGKAGIRPISGLFDNLFRIAAKRERIGTGTPPKYETHRVVFTEPTGFWLAGMRTPHTKNPIGEYRLSEDTRQFWLDIHNKGK